VKTLFAFLILLFNVVSGFSQFSCGFDYAHQRLLKTNTLYKKTFTESESRIKTLLSNKDFMKTQGTVYRVPVVVHVIHNGEAVGTGTNISNAQIQSALTSLTQYYRGTLGSSADAEVEFALASLDPNCNPTTGIVRINGSAVTNYATMGLTTGASSNETAVKALSTWPNNHFYNIWVVSEIDNNNGGGGIQGFAYFPGAPEQLDGTVILASSFGYDPGGSLGYALKGYTNLNMTLAHEMGHAFGLYHTFEGQTDSNSDGILECPVNTTCSSMGDRVCDTDPQVQSNSDCPTGNNACTGTTNNNIVHNFMDYSSEACKTNFTSGQVARMRAYMVGARPALMTSHGLNTSSPLSPYVPPVAATTTPATVVFGNGYAAIFNVSLNTRNRSSGDADDDNGYVNGTTTCLNLIQLFRGSTYTLSITILGINNEQLGAWIDYNNDGDFLDTNEQLFLAPNIAGVAGGGQVVSVNFTVPSTAPLSTAVRLRVIDDLSTVYGMGITPIASNTNSRYGQGEDYPVYFSSLLPIVLQDFSGKINAGRASLQWSTTSEQNAKGFDIERSYDGVEFKKIGYVSVTEGSGSNPKRYLFNDQEAARENNYYRLKQLDIDNKFQYSEVVYLKSSTTSTKGFTVNNPFTNYIDVAMQNVANGRLDIRLLTLTGQEVFKKSEVAGTSRNFRIDLSGKSLQNGIYILEISSNGNKYTQKVLKH
jgi:hypothetical protein